MYNNKYNSYADVLESYMIAEEGIFSKIKNKMEEKRKEREERIRLFEEEYKKALPLINKCIKDTLRDAKRKYKNISKDIIGNINVDDSDCAIDIDIFPTEYYFDDKHNPDSDKYDSTADECFKFIWKEIENKLNIIFKNYTIIKFEIECYENGTITITVH